MIGERIDSMEWKALIDGEWTDAASKEKSTLKDPSTGEVLGTVPKCGVDDARRAIDAAREAFDKGTFPLPSNWIT